MSLGSGRSGWYGEMEEMRRGSSRRPPPRGTAKSRRKARLRRLGWLRSLLPFIFVWLLFLNGLFLINPFAGLFTLILLGTAPAILLTFKIADAMEASLNTTVGYVLATFAPLVQLPVIAWLFWNATQVLKLNGASTGWFRVHWPLANRRSRRST